MQITIYLQYIDTWKMGEHYLMQKRRRRTKMEKESMLRQWFNRKCLLGHRDLSKYQWEMAGERGGMGVGRIQFWQSTLEDIFGSEEYSWSDVQLHSSSFQE